MDYIGIAELFTYAYISDKEFAGQLDGQILLRHLSEVGVVISGNAILSDNSRHGNILFDKR